VGNSIRRLKNDISVSQSSFWHPKATQFILSLKSARMKDFRPQQSVPLRRSFFAHPFRIL